MNLCPLIYYHISKKCKIRFWAIKIGTFFLILKIWKFRLWRKCKKSAVEFHSTLSFAQMNWTLQNKNASFQPQKEWALALSKSQFSVWSCFYAE
ncbi:MAG: hypothetical protein COZ85_00075 [Candidatus Moranbacteria bacterium CG_4_8_14_3_um_filter_34_16]|nr:MAG: hypothetical protein COT31_03925 [Candidatus Moranbacteria bacterium CG08_land_8_20_14_0_20_34_16]PIW95397.1 MAG: hypothetical protein COZ85_00075 [Candidatus Moranbacteria bacterium CG_4_8_14_3_um_filter_34_16]